MKHISIILILFCTLFSCRTVKKEWVQEHFAEKSELSQLAQKTQETQKTLKSEISEALILEFSQKLKQETSSSTSQENESTSVSGTIVAEEGKEKSATIGNTTIVSNGANISFQTTNSSSITKAFESKYQELESKYQEAQQTISTLQSQYNSLKSEFANFRSTYESEKNSSSRTVTKSGWSFKTWLILIAIILVIAAVLYFKKKIPFL